MRRLSVIPALLITAAVVAAPAEAAGVSYVSIGDSYTSGSLIPNQVNLPCTRSDRNYPSLVAQGIKPAKFTDASCGGATTEHMTGAQIPLNTPQFDRLKADTSLVTVGIGGNDVPFAEVVVTCAGLGAFKPHGSPCQDYYSSNGHDRLGDKVRAVGPKVKNVLLGVKARSPQAKVVLVGYPTLMPDDGTNCWPFLPISDGDAPYLRDITKLLNDVLAEQAAAVGAVYVDTYESSVGHDMCKPASVRWVEGIVPSNPAAPVHPNAAGARNQAAQVLAALS
ncbi:SGNH/GDSL hydrolase family protein [Amycolatopsis sp. cg5]|uniref:SGNH/GDSL hydrolase family protein n=1 Tax=Amycolatopsis sp. cg5 TaxID=3238802 RepID=UPI0035235862